MRLAVAVALAGLAACAALSWLASTAIPAERRVDVGAAILFAVGLFAWAARVAVSRPRDIIAADHGGVLAILLFGCVLQLAWATMTVHAARVHP